MATESIPQKQCPCCKAFKPRTSNFFGMDKRRHDGLNCYCKECKRVIAKDKARLKRLTPGYRELENSRVKKSRDKNRDKYNAAQNDYYSEWINRPGNRDRKNIRQRCNHTLRCTHIVGHSEKLARLSLAYYHKRAIDQDYRRAKSIHSSKRRKFLKQSDEHHTLADVILQYKSQKGLCWWCGKPVPQDKYEVDHIIPVSRGGSNSSRNIVVAHVRCNRSKNNKLAWEWIGRLI